MKKNILYFKNLSVIINMFPFIYDENKSLSLIPCEGLHTLKCVLAFTKRFNSHYTSSY